MRTINATAHTMSRPNNILFRIIRAFMTFYLKVGLPRALVARNNPELLCKNDFNQPCEG